MGDNARVSARVLLTASLADVKKSMHIWNGLHELGLVVHVDRPEVTVWGMGNCILAAYSATASTTAIYLIVANRQPDFIWTNGLHPDENVLTTWQQLRLLWMDVQWCKWVRHISQQHSILPDNVAILAYANPPLDDGALRIITETKLRGQGLSKYEIEIRLNFECETLRRDLDTALNLKREMEQVIDLTTEEMAAQFVAQLPSGDLEDAVADSDHDVDRSTDAFPNEQEPQGKQEPPPAVVLQSKRPGRKNDPDYDEAYERIRSGESEESVFRWFCEKNGIAKVDKVQRDAFKAAIKRRNNIA